MKDNPQLQSFIDAVYAKFQQPEAAADSSVPAGAITAFGGATAPSEWLLCNGSEISKADYPELFAAIGTTWNTCRNQSSGANYSAPAAGRFRLPDLRGVFLRGAGTSNGYSATTLAATQDDATAKNGLADSGHTHTINHDHAATTSAGPSSNSTSSTGDHYHSYNGSGQVSGNGSGNLAVHSTGSNQGAVMSTNTSSIGNHAHDLQNHTHSVDIPNYTGNSGSASAALTGDTETRPVNVGVNYIIKI